MIKPKKTKIRNFRFKTEQDDAPGWQVVDGEYNCWNDCGSQGGKCSSCGPNGYCCSKNKGYSNGNCTEEMSQAVLESPWGHETYHMCVVKTLEEACVDWTIEKDWDCGGNDIAPDPYVPGKHIYLKNYHEKP